MLDGFHFDTEYNNGPYDKARLPEAKGLSVLPSGMIPMGNPITSEIPDGVETEFELDLSDFTKSASQDISIVDHTWLASQPKPNLEGLRSHEDILEQFSEGRFEHPEVNQLKALEESWGTSTTGLDIVPNSQRKHDRYQNNYGNGISSLPGDDYRQVREKALRKLAYGKESLHEIIAEIEGLIAEKEPEKAKKLASELTHHHGLYGRVYIREKDFPGLFNGRWDEVINKRCASAQYIISEHDDCVFDRFLGRKVVASIEDIDWKETHSTLMPKLRSFGVKKASGSHKEVLKKAFIDLMAGDLEKYERPQTWWSIQENQADKVSSEDAWSKLAATEVKSVHISTPEEQGEIKTSARLERIAAQLVAEGFLDDEQVDAVLCGCGKTAKEKIARLFEISAKPTEASGYEGYGKDSHVHTPTKKAMETKFTSRETLDFKKRLSFAMARAQALVQTGLVSVKDVEKAVSQNRNTPEEITRALFKKASQVVEKSDYEGYGKETHAHSPTKKAMETKFTSRETLDFNKRLSFAMERAQALVQTGFVSLKDVEKAVSQNKSTPEEITRALFKKASQSVKVTTSSYEGVGQDSSLMTFSSSKEESSYKKAQERKLVAQSIQKKVKDLIDMKLVTLSEVEKIAKRASTNEDKLLAILKHIENTPQKVANYNGQVFTESGRLSDSELAEKQGQRLQKEAARTRKAFEAQVVDEIKTMLDNGLVTESDYEGVLKKYGSLDARLHALYELASKPRMIEKSASSLKGAQTAHFMNTAKKKVASTSEIRVSTWLRQKMTEGVAGKELDALLVGRFSENVLSEHQARIASLRQEHEGVSGHAYVDANAYVTEGSEGCDKGALIHRANQVPAILTTDKCASCVFNTDGQCQKYNKPIISSPADLVGDVKKYQREMIRLANSSDAERTASLFANNYDEDEFSLQQDSEIDLEDETPSHDHLGSILFGGFEV
jgi:hypothetical protein